MLSINDPLMGKVASDFDLMLNATVQRMKEHQEEKGEVTLKLTIELTKDSIPKEDDEAIWVDVPHFKHKVKAKWTGGNDFEGSILEPLYLIKDEEEYHLIRKKEAQISMFENEEKP